MKRWIAGVALATAVVVSAMACSDPVETVTPIKFDGEVTELVLPGPSAWVIDRLDSDVSYYPTNLPAESQVEGLQLDVEAVLTNEGPLYDRPIIEIIELNPIGTGIN